MQTRHDLNVGDRVVMRDVNERREGGPTIGVVVKIGRTLLHVVPERQMERYERAVEEGGASAGGYYVMRYYLADGRCNDGWGHRWVQTPDEHAEAEVRARLLEHLRNAGVTFTHGASLTSPQLGAILRIVRPDHDDDEVQAG